MSWLQDLAGRAENMLNKLDQNAANVLHTQSPALSTVTEDQPLIDVTVDTEMPKQLKRSKGLQLTPKKSASSSSLSDLAKGRSDESVSSRRSSVVHDEKITETAMQTSFESSVNRQAELEEICNSLVAEKEFLVQRNEQLDESNSKNMKVISELEANVSKLLRNEQEMLEKLEWAKKEREQAVMEMQQYRARAQQTLQMKEKLIDQLKQGQLDKGEDSTFTALTMEVQQLTAEKRNLTEEIQRLTEKFEQSKQIVRRLEQKCEAITEKELKIKELHDQAVVTTNKAAQVEEDLKLKNQETISIREEMLKQRTSFTAKITERETEILDLRAKLNQRRQSGMNTGTEERISSLTHSLVQKQAALESITAERNALRIQLEKVDTLQRATTMENRGHRSLRIDTDMDDVKGRIPMFMQENPFDTKFSRRVKRAYSSLDSVGVRIGAFLRRYPLARIMVIFYIVILHLWVMVVLLTSTPN